MDKDRRTRRVRGKLFGTKDKPRISVFRSNRFLYAQAIDDQASHTLASVSEAKVGSKEKVTKIERAKILGKAFGEALLKKKIKRAVFDRNGYKYHGRVKAFAEGAREGGVEM